MTTGFIRRLPVAAALLPAPAGAREQKARGEQREDGLTLIDSGDFRFALGFKAELPAVTRCDWLSWSSTIEPPLLRHVPPEDQQLLIRSRDTFKSIPESGESWLLALPKREAGGCAGGASKGHKINTLSDIYLSCLIGVGSVPVAFSSEKHIRGYGSLRYQ